MGDVAYTDITAAEGIREKMEDVIYHKGQFNALGHLGSVLLLHIKEGFPPSARAKKLTVYLVEPLVPYLLSGYLVPDILTDSIFVITRDSKFINEEDKEELSPHITLRFDIFRVSLEDKRLKRFTKVESLGDRALFLGYNSSMIVMASQFPGCKGNHIYFADNMVEKYYFSGYGCRDIGVFSLEGGTVEELFTDRFHPIWSPPLWIATPPYSSQIDFGGKKP
ncbi:hypothetical protein MRB53_023069 [Persea americana]|uniref:Uncharacterized protein n=1 Tax=Persea americana TaxID=3435 RepID=A0ACC2L8J2_PERAE|nr:hypothetical protein MRB53_023069 [Persea americana]